MTGSPAHSTPTTATVVREVDVEANKVAEVVVARRTPR
jgi:hypothetical protein